GQLLHGRGGDVVLGAELVDHGVADLGVAAAGPLHQPPAGADRRGAGLSLGDERVEAALTLDVAHDPGGLLFAVPSAAEVVPHLLLDVAADDLTGITSARTTIIATGLGLSGRLADVGQNSAHDGSGHPGNDHGLQHQ